MIDCGELKKIAEAYSKNKTFVFIEEETFGKKRYYNGHIISVKEDIILFKDSKIPNEFPILLERISYLNPSNKKEAEDVG